jgi:hypothetical protein
MLSSWILRWYSSARRIARWTTTTTASTKTAEKESHSAWSAAVVAGRLPSASAPSPSTITGVPSTRSARRAARSRSASLFPLVVMTPA